MSEYIEPSASEAIRIVCLTLAVVDRHSRFDIRSMEWSGIGSKNFVPVDLGAGDQVSLEVAVMVPNKCWE